MRVFLAMDSPSAARAFAMIATLDVARTARVVGVEENADVIVATRSHLRKNPKVSWNLAHQDESVGRGERSHHAAKGDSL